MQGKPQGFILVTTVTVLAILTLLAAWLAESTSSTTELAQRQRTELQDHIDELSTKATLTFMLLTVPMAHGGLQLEEAPLELNRTYKGLGRTRFYLQDESHLLRLNQPSSLLFSNFLTSLGLSRTERDAFRSLLVDYTDKDQIPLIQGAERPQYPKPEIPADALLISPVEITRLPGFYNMVSPENWAKVQHLLTTRNFSGVNVNKMSMDLLRRVFLLNDVQIQDLEEARSQRVLSSEHQLRNLLNLGRLEFGTLRTASSAYIRITTWHEGDSRGLVSGVALTPYREDYPWQQNYFYSRRLFDQVSQTAVGTEAALFSPSGETADR